MWLEWSGSVEWCGGVGVVVSVWLEWSGCGSGCECVVGVEWVWEWL